MNDAEQIDSHVQHCVGERGVPLNWTLEQGVFQNVYSKIITSFLKCSTYWKDIAVLKVLQKAKHVEAQILVL